MIEPNPPARPAGRPLAGARIALVVDHPQRDLPGLLLVAFELCRRGATCHLIPLNLQEREIPALAPDFVLLNYVRMFNYELARKLVRARIPIGMLDTEGGVWESPNSYTEILWRDRDLLRIVRPACMWGASLASHMIGQGYFDKSQVHVTGCARFDFYHPRWRSILDPGIHDGTAGHLRHLLINTNFSTVNPRFTTREQSIEYQHREYGWTYEAIQRIADAEDESIKGMIEIAGRLASDYPEQPIVVRPHPFENPEPYRRALARFSNVTINDWGPVQPQINAAVAVIQRSCTTAIESAAAGVPTFSPQWLPAPFLMPMAEEVSVRVDSYDALRAGLDTVFPGAYRPTKELETSIAHVISDCFHRIDGWCHRRVVDAIQTATNGPRFVDEAYCRRIAYGVDDKRLRMVQRLGARVRFELGLPAYYSFRRLRNIPNTAWMRTTKHLDPAEARNLMRGIERTAAQGGDDGQELRIDLAREKGDYNIAYEGHALTVSTGV
jgi:surface carbohydrate biosynthesis protein